MLLSAVSVLVVAQSSSEIPEGLMNNPVFVIDNEYRTRYILTALELQMIWSRNNSGMIFFLRQRKVNLIKLSCVVLLAIVTCVDRRWFGEGQVKRRPIALSTTSIKLILMTAIWKIHKTRNNILSSFMFCSHQCTSFPLPEYFPINVFTLGTNYTWA